MPNVGFVTSVGSSQSVDTSGTVPKVLKTHILSHSQDGVRSSIREWTSFATAQTPPSFLMFCYSELFKSADACSGPHRPSSISVPMLFELA